MKGLRLAGRATGHNLLEWPSGRWPDHRGEGRIAATPPDGVTVVTRTSPLAPPGGTAAASDRRARA